MLSGTIDGAPAPRQEGLTAAGHSAPVDLIDLIDNLEPPDAACLVCLLAWRVSTGQLRLKMQSDLLMAEFLRWSK